MTATKPAKRTARKPCTSPAYLNPVHAWPLLDKTGRNPSDGARLLPRTKRIPIDHT